MSTLQQPYFDCIKRTLHAALCVCNFPSPTVERHNKPEVEMQTSPELLGNPILICRDDSEQTLIETSINSVRVSMKFKMPDPTARLLGEKYVRFLEQRANRFHVLRKQPREGYDISFLITNEEADTMYKHKVIDFIIQLVTDIDRDIAEMKTALNGRANSAALEFLQACP